MINILFADIMLDVSVEEVNSLQREFDWVLDNDVKAVIDQLKAAVQVGVKTVIDQLKASVQVGVIAVIDQFTATVQVGVKVVIDH